MLPRQEALKQLDAIAKDTTIAPLKRELQAVAHKFRYPMEDILLLVPGQTLSDRARAVGVSRQTMYVWAAERFRPTGSQAIRLSELTGVPIEHIVDKFWDAARTTAPSPKRMGASHKRTRSGNGGSRGVK